MTDDSNVICAAIDDTHWYGDRSGPHHATTVVYQHPGDAFKSAPVSLAIGDRALLRMTVEQARFLREGLDAALTRCA